MEQAATTIILKMQWPQIPSWNETSIVENTLFPPMLLRSDDSDLLVLFQSADIPYQWELHYKKEWKNRKGGKKNEEIFWKQARD